MDEKIEQLGNIIKRFEYILPEIRLVVKYLNREINVDKLPDRIRNRKDAVEEIEKWNKEVEEAIRLQSEYRKEGIEMIGNFDFNIFLVTIE